MAETSQERLEFNRKLYDQNRGSTAPNRGSPGHPANQPVPKKKQKKKPVYGSEQKVRKGGPVGHRVGEQVAPNSMGGNLGGGVFGGPQMSPSIPSPPVQKRPASVKKQPSQEETMNKKIDASNKLAAAKAEDLKVAQRQSIGKPQGQPQGKPQAPGMPQGQPQPQRPPVLSRKGDTVKPQGYKRGGKVGIKDYSNVCRVANNPVA
jgi:hypothetical protein